MLLVVKISQFRVYCVMYGASVLYCFVWYKCLVLLAMYSAYRDLDTIKIAGCPKGIEDKSYSRNAFIFNFGFVFDTNVDLAPFEIVIRKLGTSFRDYEVSECASLHSILLL